MHSDPVVLGGKVTGPFSRQERKRLTVLRRMDDTSTQHENLKWLRVFEEGVSSGSQPITSKRYGLLNSSGLKVKSLQVVGSAEVPGIGGAFCQNVFSRRNLPSLFLESQ